MTRHLLRLMWNRKRQNLLLMVEIFFAFLVVAALSVVGLHFASNFRHPLGFSIERVWQVEVHRGQALLNDPSTQEADRETFRQIDAALRDLPGVERVTSAFTGPYRRYSWGQALDLDDGRHVPEFSSNRADDRFADVLGLHLVAGRWFSLEDEGTSWDPVVINRRLAATIFGDGNAVGQTITERATRDATPPARPRRVVGVIDDFRQFGELATPEGVMFYRGSLDAPADRMALPEVILIRVRPGTTASLEEAIVKRLSAIAPRWTVTVDSLDVLRQDIMRDRLVPLAIVAVLAGALLLMVALGVTGVVWQAVTQRIREFGLRRAQGATATGVAWQVVAEVVVMTAFALVAGGVLLVQIPFLPLPEWLAVSGSVFVSGALLAVFILVAVAVLCAWYPSRLATRVPPAEALRYE
jgi:putative ABC transport system permease protein